MVGIVRGTWIGIAEVEAAYTKVSIAADLAVKAALVKIAADVVKRAMGNFEGSHKKGERHVGGSKPNIVTGNLRRSIFMTPPVRSGVDWHITVAFGAMYGRAVELGKTPGSAKYPFFTPAVEASRPSWAGSMADTWSKFVI